MAIHFYGIDLDAPHKQYGNFSKHIGIHQLISKILLYVAPRQRYMDTRYSLYATPTL